MYLPKSSASNVMDSTLAHAGAAGTSQQELDGGGAGGAGASQRELDGGGAGASGTSRQELSYCTSAKCSSYSISPAVASISESYLGGVGGGPPPVARFFFI